MISEFRPRFPWWGGDLQTLRNRFVYRERPLPGRADPFAVEVKDGTGDTLTGTLHTPENPSGPLIVLFHGLTGSEDSAYMIEATRWHLSRSRRVLRTNLRGAGSSRDLCQTMYSGGSWADVLAIVDAVEAETIVTIGYSMGGNILLNALPRLPPRSRCIAAATVSAPIDPMSASRRLMQRRNHVYQKVLLDEMKAHYLDLPVAEDAAIRAAIETADSIYTFDDEVTAPTHGYGDAPTYYAQTAGKDRLREVDVPVLMIHARDDPWIPVSPYLDLRSPDHIDVLTPHSGGHVGFHGADHSHPWHDRAVSAFIDRLDL